MSLSPTARTRRTRSLTPLPRLQWSAELLQLITEYLAPFRADLWRFALTCSTISVAARRVLYRNIHFSSTQDKEVRKSLYQVLGSQTFAGCVRTVTLYTHHRDRGDDWFPFSLLSFNCWSRLESIEIIGSPFDCTPRSAGLQSLLEAAMSLSRPSAGSPLKTFIFRSLDGDPFPRTTLRLPLGLEKIEIHRATTDVFPFAIARGLGCAGNNNVAGSITHITLKGLFDPHHSAFLEILSGSFYSLVSFETGSPSVPLNAEARGRLTAFLVKHIGIQRLSLASWDYPASVQPGPATIELDPAAIPDRAGFLPSLREFQGTATQFLLFFLHPRLGFDSFRDRLHKVSLVCPPSSLKAVRDGLNDTAMPVLETVKALSLNFVPDHTHAQLATRGQEGHGQTSLVLRDCIGGFGRLCPGVTYFRGNLPIMHLNEISHLLLAFEAITILDLPIRTITPYLKQRRDEGLPSLLVLAGTQENLAHIIARAPPYSHEPDRLIAVSRVYSNRRGAHFAQDPDVVIEFSDCESGIEGHPMRDWEAGETQRRAGCGNGGIFREWDDETDSDSDML